MPDNIQLFIESGVLEAYVMGSLPEKEMQQVLAMRKKHAVINQELTKLELDLENLAMHMAVPPPTALWSRIEHEINSLVETQDDEVTTFSKPKEKSNYNTNKPEPNFIEVEAQSSYIKVHKSWRWVFGAVFILGKIFLATAIYFYIENKHNQKEAEELKVRVNQLEQLKY